MKLPKAVEWLVSTQMMPHAAVRSGQGAADQGGCGPEQGRDTERTDRQAEGNRDQNR